MPTSYKCKLREEKREKEKKEEYLFIKNLFTLFLF